MWCMYPHVCLQNIWSPCMIQRLRNSAGMPPTTTTPRLSMMTKNMNIVGPSPRMHRFYKPVYWICECVSMLFLDFITFECVCKSQRCHTLRPAGMVWWLRWIGTLVRCCGCRSLILQWQGFIYGVRTVCGELLIWRSQQKPCVIWRSLQKTHSPTPWSGPTSSQRRTTALRLN